MASSRYTGVSKDPQTGKYMYYFKAGVDLATGKPYQERRRGFNTAKEAFEARTQAMKKVHDMGGIKYTQMTFEYFMRKIYIPDYQARTVNKYSDDKTYIFEQLIEFFGKKKPKDITVFDITKYKNFLLTNYSKNGARKRFGYLGTVLRMAKRYNMVRDVLTDNVGNIPKEKVEADYWTKKEFEQFISSLDLTSYKEHFVFVTVWLYYFTGMRTNEGLALIWEDVDFEKQVINVHYNLDRKNKEIWKRNKFLKTQSSRRTISIDDTTTQVLKDWKERQSKLSKHFKFVISLDTTPYSINLLRKMMLKYSSRAGVKFIQNKGLRHSHASLLINEYNTTPLLIQKRLGHANIKTTLGIYSHLYPNADREITDNLKDLIDYSMIPKELPKQDDS